MPTTEIRHSYEADYAIPPGDTLKETLETLNLSQTDLASRTGLSIKHINQIIQGAAPITPETALMLEKVTGVPARLWNRLESNYQEQRLRRLEMANAARDFEWLKTIPVKELIKRGVIEKKEDPRAQLQEVLKFFGVANRKAWKKVWLEPQAAFRRSRKFKVDQGALAAWLRLGELDATKIKCAPFDRLAFREALQEIRKLTVESPQRFVPRITELCAACGVAVVFVKEIEGARASGAARWLSPSMALVQLSLRYGTNDHLWFSFFHEAAHVLLHGKKETFIELRSQKGDPADKDPFEVERQANDFAASRLIPTEHDDRLRQLRTISEIEEFAHDIGIAPGIVVGRLQREGQIPFKVGNHLKDRFVFIEDSG